VKPMFPPRNLLRAPNAFSELAIAAKKQQNHLHGIMQEYTAHLRRSRQRQQIIGHRRESRLLPARPLRLLCSDRAGSQSAPTTPTDKAHEGRTIAVSGDVYRFLAVGEDTNGKRRLEHSRS
jgi:hypothetical protein